MTRRDTDTPDGRVPNEIPRVIDGGRTGPRRARSGRVPQWAVDEYLGHNQEQHSWRSPSATPPKRRKGKASRVKKVRRRLPRRFAVGLGIALVAALYVAPWALHRILPPVAYSASAAAPPAGVEASDKPLGTPPQVVASDMYRLQQAPDAEQSLMAFDPCRPIHFAVSGQSRLPGAASAIKEAVAEISSATGLQFIDDGETAEKPSDRRLSYQPDTYGKRWAPVLIAWSSPGEEPDLAGDVAGLGGGQPRKSSSSPWVYVTGQVQLDTPQVAEMMLRPNGADITRGLVMHELAHVLGLDHVNDPTQLMYSEANLAAPLGDGDRAGLARVGQGECVKGL